MDALLTALASHQPVPIVVCIDVSPSSAVKLADTRQGAVADPLGLLPRQTFEFVGGHHADDVDMDKAMVVPFVVYRPGITRVDIVDNFTPEACINNGSAGLIRASHLLEEIVFHTGNKAKYGA